MWLQLFAVVLAIAMALGLGAIALESYEETKPVRDFEHR